ncbi:MAG: TerB family tellurite resistance protein [Nitrospiraceae bacterium]
MPGKSFIMNLAKLLIAAAWADGELSNDEVNALKDLLFLVPDMTGEDWLELELYMVSPVNPQERDRLLRTVLDEVRSARDKKLVIRTVKKLMEADGSVSEEEAAVLQQVQQDVERSPTGLLSHLATAMRGAVGKRSRHSGAGATREDRLDDFIKNRIYYRLVSEREQTGVRLNLPDAQIRKLCLAAGMMARVAWVDANVSESEKTVMSRALVEGWGLSHDEAGLVTEISLSSAVKGLDGVRLTRNFFERTTHKERKAFLRCLFTVANAAHKTTFEEIHTIQTLAKGLKLTHKEFIEAKLTIPREDRAGL